MVVLGGGPIGCELAQCFARFGSKVTLVEMAEQIMNREDDEFSEFIAGQFAAEGIRVLTGHRAQRIRDAGGASVLECARGDDKVELQFDAMLVALGRAARTTGYGLENLQIPLTPRGTVEVNAWLQAGYANIYAVGDVTGPYQFTHAAAHQAWYASVNALFSPFKKFKVDLSLIHI